MTEIHHKHLSRLVCELCLLHTILIVERFLQFFHGSLLLCRTYLLLYDWFFRVISILNTLYCDIVYVNICQFHSCRFISKQQIPSMKGGRVPGWSQLSGIFLHLLCSVLSATSGLHHRAPKGIDNVFIRITIPFVQIELSLKTPQFLCENSFTHYAVGKTYGFSILSMFIEKNMQV